MLRAATEDDLPFLWEMLAAAVSADPPWTVDQAKETPPIARYLEDWARPGDAGLVGVDGDPPGRLVGAAWYRLFTEAEPGYGFVDANTPELTVACPPQERGRGIGRALLEGLLDRAHREGVRRLSLSVAPQNLVARWLYQDLGFVPVGHAASGASVTMVGRSRPISAHARPVVRAVDPGDLDPEVLARSTWGDVIASRGRLLRTADLAAVVAEVDGQVAGLATWKRDDDEVELVGLESWVVGRGVGTALMGAVRRAAADAGCDRVWLVTTNDNTRALAFYQRRGWELVAVHLGGVDRSRTLKPSIPWLGDDDIPIRHELELELRLVPSTA